MSVISAVMMAASGMVSTSTEVAAHPIEVNASAKVVLRLFRAPLRGEVSAHSQGYAGWANLKGATGFDVGYEPSGAYRGAVPS